MIKGQNCGSCIHFVPFIDEAGGVVKQDIAGVPTIKGQCRERSPQVVILPKDEVESKMIEGVLQHRKITLYVPQPMFPTMFEKDLGCGEWKLVPTIETDTNEN